jgi:hypothetical protein
MLINSLLTFKSQKGVVLDLFEHDCTTIVNYAGSLLMGKIVKQVELDFIIYDEI